MQVQSINNNTPSFGALNITAEAKALLKNEKGGAEKIAQYTSELANSRWDLNVKTIGKNSIYSSFGNKREACVIPSYYENEYIMVYSGLVGGDTDDDVVDCLKFSSAERAKEVFETLKSHFLTGGKPKTPLQHLDWDVYAMKAFTEAELVPQIKSPWARFLSPASAQYSVERYQNMLDDKPVATKKKPSFFQRLNAAWNVLLGK